MGQSMSTTYKTYVSSPDTSPNVLGDATYSHDYGFHAERKKRKPVLTMEQMEAACIDPEWRDYCAHHLVEFDKCRRDHFPWVIACAPQKHAWQQCQVEDIILRMKEYERERRLMERAKKKKLQAASQRSEVLVE